MTDRKYTAITFSPVTEFIEKTRKLRDLYGSSFILSYLSQAICKRAKEELGDAAVISPALVEVAMGTPDQIIIKGHLPEETAKQAFFDAWGLLVDECREWVCRDKSCGKWIADACQRWNWDRKGLPWDRDWQLWRKNAWEVFCVHSNTLPGILDALSVVEEHERNWAGINWIGESSTLSGADAIAWPGLDRGIPPNQLSMRENDQEIKSFVAVLNQAIGAAILDEDLQDHPQDEAARLRQLATRYDIDLKDREQSEVRQDLSKKLGEAIITPREQPSIPELVKRLSTLKAIAQRPSLQIQFPASFKDVNLWTSEHPMGWFRGDGDRAGKHIHDIIQANDPQQAEQALNAFSYQMRSWGQWLQQAVEQPLSKPEQSGASEQELGRIIIAGGDDFLGVFYPNPSPARSIEWLCNFKAEVWHKGENAQDDPKPITPSVGFVWASPQVPQRDILQHCELAEQRAKAGGRDRVCLRVLFASGNYLDWLCPWWLLPKIIRGYGDRNHQQDWTHIFKDMADLEARHAFAGNHQVALALFNLFFDDPDDPLFPSQPTFLLPTDPNELFADDSPLWRQQQGDEWQTGILNDELKEEDLATQQAAFNEWVRSLAKVGFHLFQDVKLS